MRLMKICCFLLLLVWAMHIGAQEFNSVPLDHAAYDIIEMGVLRGVISQPPLAKPWSESFVKRMLWDMVSDPAQILSTREIEAVTSAIESFERRVGYQPLQGRYRTESSSYTFEAGLGWESVFSVYSDKGSTASVNLATVYAGGDLADYLMSWNLAVQGAFLSIDRDAAGAAAFFPNSMSKQWDGGVLSLRNPGAFAAWPDDPSLAYSLLGEVNVVSFDNRMQFRLGRIRRDWGQGTNGASLFMNAHARPFTAIEGTISPLSWMNISFLGGALERYREESQWPGGPVTNMLTLAQVEFNPVRFMHFSVGGTAVLFREFNGGFFTNLELRLPGTLRLWGSLFVDSLGSLDEFFSITTNSYAYQAGLRTAVRWLPFAVFTLQYTKVEPYVYTGSFGGANWEGAPSPNAFASGGESLGRLPNSDELLIRLESRLFPEIKAYVQFQLMRHGADFGYGAVPGSSLRDTLDRNNPEDKSFLMDGVYRWNNVLKLGGSVNLRIRTVPLAVFAEAGYVTTRYTINGNAGVGNEGEYESLNDRVYRARSGLLFSIGFRLF